MVPEWLTLGEFYTLDPRRASSREVKYGTLWRKSPPVSTYRLSWVQSTGELYVVQPSEPDERRDPVEVPGVLWNQSQVDACLEGWNHQCGGQRSLLWAEDRVCRWRPVVEETQFTEAHPDPGR
jgi:hypothetical protein